MKLSEAIRLGATISPQIKEHLINGKGGTCALGSAGIAVGMDIKDTGYCYDDLEERFPILLTACHSPAGTKDTCVSGCGWHVKLRKVIAHLNDCHDWTREQIADWVSTLEQDTPQETPAEIPTTVSV